MPSPTVGKLIQYFPGGTQVQNLNFDLDRTLPGVIIATSSDGHATLRIWTEFGAFILYNVLEDDTQTTPNTWTYASQTS